VYAATATEGGGCWPEEFQLSPTFNFVRLFFRSFGAIVVVCLSEPLTNGERPRGKEEETREETGELVPSKSLRNIDPLCGVARRCSFCGIRKRKEGRKKRKKRIG